MAHIDDAGTGTPMLRIARILVTIYLADALCVGRLSPGSEEGSYVRLIDLVSLVSRLESNQEEQENSGRT